jgi:hypothetical protein
MREGIVDAVLWRLRKRVRVRVREVLCMSNGQEQENIKEREWAESILKAADVHLADAKHLRLRGTTSFSDWWTQRGEGCAVIDLGFMHRRRESKESATKIWWERWEQELKIEIRRLLEYRPLASS